MRIFPKGSQSVLSRIVAAEVRARLAAERMSQRDFAKALGFSSLNYLAIRLRDEKPFSLDDVDRITGYWDEDPWSFIQRASDSHGDRIWDELGRQGVDENEQQSDDSEARILRVDVVFDAEAADPAAGSGGFLRKSMSSFDEADEAARAEDTEKPRLD